MSEDGADLTSERTSDNVTVDLGGRNIFVSLGEGHQGVSLEQLEDEAPLEIRAGSEKYQVLKTVGEGGMGKVYAAVDRDLKRPVALKMMRVSGDRKLEQRFLEEAQVMGQLQHPNILAVHELGLTEKKKLYYTMPLVRGRTLKTVLDELRQGQEKTRRTWSVTGLVQSEEIQGTGDARRVHRVLRGGHWVGAARDCRAANRYWLGPAYVRDDVGLRLARSRFWSGTPPQPGIVTM